MKRRRGFTHVLGKTVQRRQQLAGLVMKTKNDQELVWDSKSRVRDNKKPAGEGKQASIKCLQNAGEGVELPKISLAGA